MKTSPESAESEPSSRALHSTPKFVVKQIHNLRLYYITAL